MEFRPGAVPAPRSAEVADRWARFAYGVEHVLRRSGFDTSQGFDAVWPWRSGMEKEKRREKRVDII